MASAHREIPGCDASGHARHRTLGLWPEQRLKRDGAAANLPTSHRFDSSQLRWAASPGHQHGAALLLALRLQAGVQAVILVAGQFGPAACSTVAPRTWSTGIQARCEQVMFNWSTAPTFAAMLLFWLLAVYILTRSRRNAISIAAVAATAATAAFLLGEAMEANAPSPEEWQFWARGLRWGGPVAAMAWYWLTALLLREQATPLARGYLRAIGYPLGVLIAAGGLVLTASIYIDDVLWAWSAGPYEATDEASYLRYYPGAGPLYSALVTFIVGAALGTAGNLALAWYVTSRESRHRRFGWLLVSAVLFIPEVGSVTTYHWFRIALPTWFNHLALAVAMAVMAANVAAYHHLRHGQTIRQDLLYFLTAWSLICATFAPFFHLAGGGYNFRLLGLMALTLVLTILSHGLVDPARRILDRLFLGHEVRRLRTSLASVVQDAALTRDQDLGALLSQAQAEIAEVSREHLVRLTEEALRRLNNPAALAECGLIARLPRTLAAMRALAGDGEPREATPLEQAKALREVLARAIDQLKPPDRAPALGAPEALQYYILREEYLLGMPNNQIMTRHSISEGTFHRNRRQAIAVLAQELAMEEARQPLGQH